MQQAALFWPVLLATIWVKGSNLAWDSKNKS